MIDICFVHFRSLSLAHLDAAWYSVSRQGFEGVRSVQFLDNNTDHAIADIEEVLARYPLPVPVECTFEKHGDPTKTQSWSVNRVCRDLAQADTVLFTRSDYILAFDCVQQLRVYAEQRPTERLFLSGWCWQMAYDREARNIDAHVDIEQYHWRHHGLPALLAHPYAFQFHETDQDAGVWLTKREYLAQAGWMNEGMVSWGFQQSEFQRRVRGADVTCVTLPTYLFAHQHHYADRDFDRARREWQQASGR